MTAKEAEYLWWDYMEHVHTHCFSKIDDSCSRAAHQKINITYENTMKCVTEGFYNNSKDYTNAENSVLEVQAQRWELYGPYWPSVVLNGVTFRTKELTAENILEAIC